jgi:hypothetical protein
MNTRLLPIIGPVLPWSLCGKPTAGPTSEDATSADDIEGMKTLPDSSRWSNQDIKHEGTAFEDDQIVFSMSGSVVATTLSRPVPSIRTLPIHGYRWQQNIRI